MWSSVLLLAVTVFGASLVTSSYHTECNKSCLECGLDSDFCESSWSANGSVPLDNLKTCWLLLCSRNHLPHGCPGGRTFGRLSARRRRPSRVMLSSFGLPVIW